MRTIYILGLGAAGAIGAALGCATVIGLSPAEQMACTDPADQAVLVGDQASFVANVVGCAAPHSGDLGAIVACIQTTDKLSKPCADCAAVYGACASQQCSMMCSGGAVDATCQKCIAAHCNPTLIACGGTPVDACIDSSDQAALQKHAANFEVDMEMCGTFLPKGANAVVACIQQMDELSQPCALCYSQEDICALTQCLSSCPKDPTSSACTGCVGNLCVPAFTLCSGVAPDAGP